MRKKHRARATINAGRWASYALAGTATALAAANEADAAIYYSGTINQTIVYNGGNGLFDMRTFHTHVRGSTPIPGSSSFVGAFIQGGSRSAHHSLAGFDMLAKGGRAVGIEGPSSTGYVSRLKAGVNVAAGPFLTSGQGILQFPAGPFPNFKWTNFNGTAFVGFEFKYADSSQEQYGWARLTMYGGSTNGNNYSITIDDYAIGSPGQAMVTGQEPAGWTGAHDTNWNNSLNWSGGVVPGATVGSSSTDIALFNQNAPNQALIIDSGRNLQGIMFDSGGGSLTTSLTVGTTTGNPLTLSPGGQIETTSLVANAQYVNAPLILAGNYTFNSTATTSAATLNFGGGITPLEPNSTSILTLSGSNTGANTISGPIDNGSNAAAIALTVQGGNWVVSAVNTYTGPTTLSGGQLTVSGSGSIANSSLVSLSGGAVLELAGSTAALGATVAVANNSSAVNGLDVAGMNQVAGVVSGTGNTVVEANSSLTAYQIRQNSLTIGSGATVTLRPSGSGSTTNPAGPNNINFSSSVTSLSIAGTMNAWTGTLDIGNNGLVIAYGTLANDPYATINNMVESGYNGGVWGGTGITSTLAQAGVAQHIATPLNIGLLDFTPGTGNYSNTTFIVFEGQTVTTNAILVRLTYMDDLVLAGDMASNNATSDALLFAANYGTGTTWGVGDLVHNGGPIDSSDALLFAANYVVGLPSLDGSTGGDVALVSSEAAVPEPASLGLLAIGAVGVLAIRRARNRKNRPVASCLAPSQLFVPDLDDETLLPLAAYVGRE